MQANASFSQKSPERNACIRGADDAGISTAVEILRAGGVIGLPTETVYGLAADAFNAKAVASIFSIKRRPAFDPLIVHVPDLFAARELVTQWPPAAQVLAEKFWPGPFTLVLPKNEKIPDLVTSGLPHVAIRAPSHPVAQAVLRAFGNPLAAPSANRFGSISPTTAQAVATELGNEVPIILDGGPCDVGLESTIVSLTTNTPTVLRLGGVSLEQLETVLGQWPPQAPSILEKPDAPGQLAQHYAPRKALRLIERIDQIPTHDRMQAGLLVFSPAEISPPEAATAFVHVEILSPRGDLLEAATRFFAALRALDASPAQTLYAIPAPEKYLGRAINDRLRRAVHS